MVLYLCLLTLYPAIIIATDIAVDIAKVANVDVRVVSVMEMSVEKMLDNISDVKVKRKPKSITK